MLKCIIYIVGPNLTSLSFRKIGCQQRVLSYDKKKTGLLDDAYKI